MYARNTNTLLLSELLPVYVFVRGQIFFLHPCLSHVEHVRRVCEEVLMIAENVAAALLCKGSLPLNNAVPLL